MDELEVDTRSLSEVIIHTIILALDTFLALAGNSLVCIAFHRNRRLRTLTNFYVLSLAVADIMTGIFSLPFATVASGLGRLGRWPYNYYFTQFTGFFAFSWGQISISILTLASINRYFCVVKPNRYSQFFTKRNTILSIVAAWLFSFIISLTFFTVNVEHKWSPKILFWRATFIDEDTERITHIFWSSFYLAPIPLVIFCYGSIYRVVKRHNSAIVPSLQDANIHGTISTHETKAFRVILAALLGFCFTWTPLLIVTLLEYGPQLIVSPSVQSTCSLLASFAAWINPVIYGVMNRAMRKEFRNILLCRKQLMNRGRNLAPY